jgi:hypothetical protein
LIIPLLIFLGWLAIVLATMAYLKRTGDIEVDAYKQGFADGLLLGEMSTPEAREIIEKHLA